VDKPDIVHQTGHPKIKPAYRWYYLIYIATDRAMEREYRAGLDKNPAYKKWCDYMDVFRKAYPSLFWVRWEIGTLPKNSPRWLVKNKGPRRVKKPVPVLAPHPDAVVHQATGMFIA
jgi:hypothetical protein